MKLNDGQFFTFDLQDIPGTTERVRLPHPEILNTLRVGDILLLDDGKLRMTVTNTTMALLPENEGSVTCQVVHGGMLSNKKGVNTPSVVLPISPLTPKDRRYYFQFRLCDIYFFIDVVECNTHTSLSFTCIHFKTNSFSYYMFLIYRDLAFILSLGGEVDWVALSFVQTPQDMIEFRQLAGDSVRLMAKLEKPSAIDFLDEVNSTWFIFTCCCALCRCCLQTD